MTQRVSKAEKDKVVSLLAQYLEGRSEVFQNKVYELVIRYSWDVNDPSFAILLATGQMETILESFPEQFEALFIRLMQESQQAFIKYQQLAEAQQSQFKDYVQGLEVQQSQSMGLLHKNIQAFQQGIEAQHQSHLRAIEQVMTVAKDRRSELFDELKGRLATVERQFIAQAEQRGYELIRQAGAIWNKKALREILWWAAAAGIIIFLLGFLFGIFVNQTFVSRFSDNFWATKLWSWNQDSYTACVEAHKTTCNFHIVPPK